MKVIVRNIASLVLMIILCFSVMTSCAPTEKGTVWHYGEGEPSDALLAAIGDFYMKTDTGEVYVLDESGWKCLASLNGRDGKDGVDGKDGSVWLYGTSAPTSADGKDGDFWLDNNTLKMYKKASGAWSEIADFNK